MPVEAPVEPLVRVFTGALPVELEPVEPPLVECVLVLVVTGGVPLGVAAVGAPTVAAACLLGLVVSGADVDEDATPEVAGAALAW